MAQTWSWLFPKCWSLLPNKYKCNSLDSLCSGKPKKNSPQPKINLWKETLGGAGG